jgi:receptor protein-tyrosine kinase
VSIIEQAARRLEQLQRSGVELPPGRGREASAAPAGSITEAVRRMEAMAAPGTDDLAGVVASPGQTDAGPGAPRSRAVQIDLKRLAAAGFVTVDTPRSQLADEFRVIKRPLLANAQGRSAAPVARGNLIMVTSSIPGEGKTFTAINLAMSIAMELDSTVLLVDADVSRPSVLERLGLPPSAGLLDVLSDPAISLSDVLLRTNVERLSLLPAGTPKPQATELLASEAMNRLLEDMATRYSDRVLVFDAPPLLPSTESRVLATHMGQIVLVVEAERTPQASVEQALAAIESCPVVHTILNKVPHSKLAAYYGYYGQYGY